MKCNLRKLNPKNKVCIYLDQFVISDIMSGKNPYWNEIKKLLEFNHSKGKIYCPLSIEHILETVKKDIKGAIKHDSYYQKLSDSYILKTEPFLTSQIISSRIRKNRFTINTFLKSYKPNNLENVYYQINEYNKVFDESLTDLISSQNGLRKLADARNNSKLELQFMTAIQKIEVEVFKNRLKEYLMVKSIRIRPEVFGEHQFPHWIDQILYQLTYKHKFKEKQFKLLLKEIDLHGFSNIPTLHTKLTLKSYIAVKNKQENTGDHIDLMRVSSGLFTSDILFTDRKRKYEICALELDKKYNTKVFSGVDSDLIEVINLLKKM